MNKRPQELNESIIPTIIAWLLRSGLTWEQIWEKIQEFLPKPELEAKPETLPRFKGDTPIPDSFEEERMTDHKWNSLVECAAQVGRGLNEQRKQEEPVKKYPPLTPKSVGELKPQIDVTQEAENIIKLMLQMQQGKNNIREASNSILSPTLGSSGKTTKSKVGLDLKDIMSSIPETSEASSNPLVMWLIRWIYDQFLGPLK